MKITLTVLLALLLSFSSAYADKNYSKEYLDQQKRIWEVLEKVRRDTHARRSKGGDCKTVSEGVEVCITGDGGEFDCKEDFRGNIFEDCDVNLEYGLHTYYEGGSTIDINVRCEVSIIYKMGKWPYEKSDKDSRTASHSLGAYDTSSNRMDFDFRFSTLSKVYDVNVSSTMCDITDVNLN